MLPQRKHTRLKYYDYNKYGFYFLTLCTEKRKKLFANIVGAIHKSPLRNRSEISKIVGYLKMNVSKQIHEINKNEVVWQRSYYDHIIRNQEDYYTKANYILNNPLKWQLDELYIK